MAEATTLREHVVTLLSTWQSKWLNEDGTAKEVDKDTALQYCVNEITQIYVLCTDMATIIDSLITQMNANVEVNNKNFEQIDKHFENIQTVIGNNNEAHSKQLQQLSGQMTAQNKVLDTQVLKLAKSIAQRGKK